MRGVINRLLLIGMCALACVSCKEYQVSEDPTLRLTFSADTLCFDTILTGQGSATLLLTIYNPNSKALLIDHIWMEENRYFRINIDGEQQIENLTNLPVYGGDSLFVFVRVTDFGEVDGNIPVIIEDLLHFHLSSGVKQSVVMQAYGQNVIRLGKAGNGRQDYASYHFTAERPYLLFDTIVVHGNLTIDAGSTLYMHNGACLYAGGDVNAEGTINQPILIRGDRLDNLFDSVPYLYAGGSWNGIYLQSDKPQNYNFSYVDILSGNIGLYCYCASEEKPLSTLRMDGCRIHNHTLYGLVLVHTDAVVTNTEISNCASYCVYCSGGTHDFIHSTIASYFGATNIRIQTTSKTESAAVFIDNLQKTGAQTISSFYNSIITGYLTNQLVVATPFDYYYPGRFVGNYLKTDSLSFPHAKSNVYWHAEDTMAVFRNSYYKYKEYVYYNFRLDTLSPARNIGDSLLALPYPTDRDGHSRAHCKPDAGCYQSE